MDFNKLKTFYAVANTGSIRKASETLNINPALITRNITILEQEIGHKLFETLKQRIILTPKGQEFLTYAERTLANYHGILEKLKLENTEPTGWLTISATNAITHMSLIKDLATFMDKNPSLKIKIISQQDAPDLLMGKADIVLTTEFNESPHVDYQYLTSFKQYLYASEAYLNKYGTPQKIDDLKNHKMLAYHAFSDLHESNNILNWHFKLTTPPLSADFIINSGLGLVQATDLGLGISMLSHICPKYAQNKLIRILPEVEGPEIKLYFSCLSELKASPKIQQLFEFLQKQMNNNT